MKKSKMPKFLKGEAEKHKEPVKRRPQFDESRRERDMRLHAREEGCHGADMMFGDDDE